MQKNVLELVDVWKVYDTGDVKVQALKGISLAVKEGEFVSVVGASGSGKSTALGIMGALDTPSKGHVLLDGIDVATLAESELARVRGRKIGFVFQAFNLYPTLTVMENIALPMRIHEMPEAEIEKKVKELVAAVGLSHREGHLPKQLSGGEKQRVAIARALSTTPSMVLADEPTGNLDSHTGEEIMGLFDDLNKRQGKTIVLVTHEREIAAHAKRTITLKDGKILSDEWKKGAKK